MKRLIIDDKEKGPVDGMHEGLNEFKNADEFDNALVTKLVH